MENPRGVTRRGQIPYLYLSDIGASGRHRGAAAARVAPPPEAALAELRAARRVISFASRRRVARSLGVACEDAFITRGRVRRALPAPLVTFETTAGTFVLELAPEAAPRTVENFLHYVRGGFYPGTVFHRVIPGFVAQAGGYTKERAKKPSIRPPIPLETSPLKHTDGALGMARLPDPNTATSEFYVCDGAQPELDGKYCVFGRLVDGRDTLRRILSGPTKSDDWPVDPPVITRAYEGGPQKGAAPSGATDAESVRAAAKKLRGRAAMLRARKPLLAMGEVEAAIALADRTGKAADLQRAEQMLADKERK